MMWCCFFHVLMVQKTDCTLTVFSSFEEVNLKINEEEMKICFHYDPTTPDSEQTFYQLKNCTYKEAKETANSYLENYFDNPVQERGNLILAAFKGRGWI